MFQYKDLRMLFISILLELACVAAMIYFFNEKMKLIIALFLFISLLPTLIIRFNSQIFDDSMIVYVFKGFAILPEMIDFKDIKDYKQLSKHRLIITHKKTSKLYLVNAALFKDELDHKYMQYKKEL